MRSNFGTLLPLKNVLSVSSCPASRKYLGVYPNILRSGGFRNVLWPGASALGSGNLRRFGRSVGQKHKKIFTRNNGTDVQRHIVPRRLFNQFNYQLMQTAKLDTPSDVGSVFSLWMRRSYLWQAGALVSFLFLFFPLLVVNRCSLLCFSHSLRKQFGWIKIPRIWPLVIGWTLLTLYTADSGQLGYAMLWLQMMTTRRAKNQKEAEQVFEESQKRPTIEHWLDSKAVSPMQVWLESLDAIASITRMVCVLLVSVALVSAWTRIRTTNALRRFKSEINNCRGDVEPRMWSQVVQIIKRAEAGKAVMAASIVALVSEGALLAAGGKYGMAFALAEIQKQCREDLEALLGGTDFSHWSSYQEAQQEILTDIRLKHLVDIQATGKRVLWYHYNMAIVYLCAILVALRIQPFVLVPSYCALFTVRYLFGGHQGIYNKDLLDRNKHFAGLNAPTAFTIALPPFLAKRIEMAVRVRKDTEANKTPKREKRAKKEEKQRE